jgi:hypothetical protein
LKLLVTVVVILLGLMGAQFVWPGTGAPRTEVGRRALEIRWIAATVDGSAFPAYISGGSPR